MDGVEKLYYIDMDYFKIFTLNIYEKAVKVFIFAKNSKYR